MDEDDDGDKGIELKNLFKPDDDMPYHVEITLEDHHNCKELITESIDKFNERLDDPEINSAYFLDDTESLFDKNYCIYSAKKKGAAKDDYPSFSLMTNVKKANHERFSLSCFSSAFIDSVTYKSKLDTKQQ